MENDGFNMSMRKFLKRVGVTSQAAIEEATRARREAGDSGDVPARIILEVDGKAVHEVDGMISLKDCE